MRANRRADIGHLTLPRTNRALIEGQTGALLALGIRARKSGKYACKAVLLTTLKSSPRTPRSLLRRRRRLVLSDRVDGIWGATAAGANL